MERSNRVILQFSDQYMKKKVFFKIRRVEGNVTENVQVCSLLWLVRVIWKLHVTDTLLMSVGRKPKQHIDFVILLNTHLKLIHGYNIYCCFSLTV